MSIVPTNINYHYSLFRQNLINLKNTYRFLNIQIIGKSILGKNIYVIKLGKRFKRNILLRFNSCK